jgi:hypothetical protein
MLYCAPITSEIIAKIKDVILYEEYLAAVDTHHRHAAVFAIPAFAVLELEVPMHSNHVVPG